LKTYSVDDLLLAAKPPQFEILERLVAVFSASPSFVKAYVRGSIANRNFDRASDVDFVAVFDDQAFVVMIQLAENILRAHFNVILPPWLDTIVPNFGGTGFVYLVEVDGELFSIDLYLLPASKIERLEQMTTPKLIYDRQQQPSANDLVSSLAQSGFQGTQRQHSSPVVCFVEAVTISFLLLKRISRNQVFLNYSETHLLNRALCRLVRSIFDPEHIDYGWYLLEETPKNQVVSRPVLDQLRRMIQAKPVSEKSDVADKLRFAIKLLMEEDPQGYGQLETGIKFFLNYFYL